MRCMQPRALRSAQSALSVPVQRLARGLRCRTSAGSSAAAGAGGSRRGHCCQATPTPE
jgi:hypothetical protein